MVLHAAERAVLAAAIRGPDRSARDQGDESDSYDAIGALLPSALASVNAVPERVRNDVEIRLRILHAAHDPIQRMQLLGEARQLRLPRTSAALVLAAEARRNAQEGLPDEAEEHWRLAVAYALQDGRTEDANRWLYALRDLKVRYGPWSDRLDEEHHLARALPRTTADRIVSRRRDFEVHARRAALDGRPIEATLSTLWWLTDSIVYGDWNSESGAFELLGGLYAENGEPELAAICLQRAGKKKELVELAGTTGDRRLPALATSEGPWWQLQATLALLAAQHDLIPDDEASELIDQLIDLTARGRAGELTENPARALTDQATRTLLATAHCGTADQAATALATFDSDALRPAGGYFPHDKEHTQACRFIAAEHSSAAALALERLVALAEVGVDDAQHALSAPDVVRQLRGDQSSDLDGQIRAALNGRVRALADGGNYYALIAVVDLDGTDAACRDKVEAVRDRILNRSEPAGNSRSIGTVLASDTRLVRVLDEADCVACAVRVIAIAEDRREVASTRQEALEGLAGLVECVPDGVRRDLHARARRFVAGDHEESALGEFNQRPHPLSAFKIFFGPGSLRAGGLALAHSSAITTEDRAWVVEQAQPLLGSSERRDVHVAASILSDPELDAASLLDVGTLVHHANPAVRQLAAVLATSHARPTPELLQLLAEDADAVVRQVVADRVRALIQTDLREPGRAPTPAIEAVIRRLQSDARRSVRSAIGSVPD